MTLEQYKTHLEMAIETKEYQTVTHEFFALIAKNYLRLIEALEKISKYKYEAIPWIAVDISTSRIAKEALEKLVTNNFDKKYCSHEIIEYQGEYKNAKNFVCGECRMPVKTIEKWVLE